MKFSRGTAEPAFVEDTEVEVDPADLVPLSVLASEGFGWDVASTPLGAIDALAVRFGHEVVLDDIGGRCVNREAARSLFVERAEYERRRREVQARNNAKFAEQAEPVPSGIPVWIPDGVTPAAALLQAVKDAGPRRQRVLEHALANGGEIEYHPLETAPS